MFHKKLPYLTRQLVSSSSISQSEVNIPIPPSISSTSLMQRKTVTVLLFPSHFGKMSNTLLVFLLLLGWEDASASSRRDSAGGGGELWCVAKNNAEDADLQNALDWACGAGNANCQPIQQGGDCFEPNDIQSHASYAFNDYYIHNGNAASACDFSGTAALTSLDPSHGNCVFTSSSSARNGSFSGSANSGMGPASFDMSAGAALQQHRTCAFLLTMAFAMVLSF